MNHILFYLLFISFSIYSGKHNLYKVISDSEIILTIKGNNTQPILNNEIIEISDLNVKYHNYTFNETPSEILVNGNKIDIIDYYVYNLTLDENNITIKFNTTLKNCNVMFAGLSNIIKIYFKKFDFSGTQIIGMFYNCKNLIELDLSNFSISSATQIDYMFYLCENLISLDLSNLNTSSVTSMFCLFNGCFNLKSLNLNNFDTSSTTNMEYMFSSCFKLTSLDLRNFNTSKATTIAYMFNRCYVLTSLDLSNFDTSSVTRMHYLFRYCTTLTSLDLSNFNTSSIKTMNLMFSNSSNLITLNLSNFSTSSVTQMVSMFEGCKNLISLDLRTFDTSSVKRMDSMFKNCTNLIFLDLSNFNTSSVTNKKYLNYIFDGLNSNFLYCINDNASNNLITKLNSYNYTNNCSDVCFYKYKKIIYDIRKCTFNCPDEYKLEYYDICYSSCPYGSHNENDICIKNDDNYNLNLLYNNYIDYFKDIIKKNNTLNNKDNIIINIENELIKNNLDIYLENIIIKQNKDLLIKENNIIYQLTSTYNQNNNEYYNRSTINLGECENKLRKYYNIDDNIALIILKIDIFEDGVLIPIIEYKVYNSKTKVKLDLNICNDIIMNINIPVNIDESILFKYNSSHEYYNDICYPYTTENNTDIILKDRRKEYIANNMSLCESNCKYTNYDYNTKKVTCECFIKIKFPLMSEIEINKDKLLINFINIKSLININVIKCYKQLFDKEGLKNNLGNYIIGSIIILIIILSVLFKVKGYNIIKSKIYGIIKVIIEVNKITNNPPKKHKILNKKKDLNSKLELSKTKMNKGINIFLKKEENNLRNSLLNKYIKLNDYEMNNLSYEEALELDKRTYFQFYLSLLKTNHILVFTFYTSTDYNSKIIKIILFLFSFALYFTINASFFNDETLHKIYEDQGNFNFIYQIPQILYSSIITSIISVIIKFLSLTEKNIIEIKKVENNILEKSSKLLKCLVIKFVLFFLLIFLFLFIFWYYLLCFCGVYRNTQIHLIKDTLISFGLSLFYPFLLVLLPGILRIKSLNGQKSECMYIMSKIIQIF